jgi:hypothetical protein
LTDVGFARWDWILASIALHTLASLLNWVVLHGLRQHPGSSNPSVPTALRTIVASPWLVQPLRFVYGIGIPALVLFTQGSLSSRGMGLKPLPWGAPQLDASGPASPTVGDWASDLGWVVLLVLVIWAAVAAGLAHAKPAASAPSSGRSYWAVALREATYYQVHWAFYREPFVVLWGAATGVWLAALPVLLELVVSPTFWESARAGREPYARRLLLRGGLFVAGGLLYLKTGNLWATILADAGAGWLSMPRLQGNQAAVASGGPVLAETGRGDA